MLCFRDHMKSTTTIFFFSFSSIFLVCSYLKCCAARDTVTTSDSITDNNSRTLVSVGKKFQLGFFSPGGKDNKGRYIGIWYCKDPLTVVWVANRDKPLPDSIGVFKIAEDGNLKLLDDKKNSYFSTSLGSSELQSTSRTAKLLDTGNLVLIEDESGTWVWKSFDNPTDTFLPGMKMDDNLRLTSWKSLDDPGIGNFTFEQDQASDNHYTVMNGGRRHWKSGESGGFIPSDKMYHLAASLLTNFDTSVSPSNHAYKGKQLQPGTPIDDYNNTRLLMNSSGQIQYFTWDDNMSGWDLKWSEPQDNCSIYNFCGKFGICNRTIKRVCECLEGFEAVSQDNWDSGDFSGGCKRRSEILCEYTEQSKFSNLRVVDVATEDSPFIQAESKEKCQEDCRWNCDCQAYSYRENAKRIGSQSCWIWTSDLKNLQVQAGIGYNIYVRTVIPDIGNRNPEESGGDVNKKASSSSNPLVKFIILIAVVPVLCCISYIVYRKLVATKRRENRESIGSENPDFHLYDSERQVRHLIDSGQFKEDDKKGIDVPFFELECILVATNFFSDANKLGQGGFGPVYKGKFPWGQEMAVKRLSSHSGQGLDEFKNEVVLIAKLQHRNLVRLLGYCIQGDEKILLYEYMLNKSLDAFIFDRTMCLLLDWGKRFDIIFGVARGLLYLHQDSRLRIIHRDLKTSNILLDEEMNPKISDFGLARMVVGKEIEANTNRVIGTYGYMSPEYALNGLFSIKSDVFSFGVVLLEIISGKRNTGFYESQEALNLLGYAWRLWQEERALDLMDVTLLESYNRSEVLKCIIVGLLCVQEDPTDRPPMSNVVFMLGSEAATLPNPKQPAFVARKRLSDTPSSSSSKAAAHSNVEMTVSIEEGR